MAYPRRRHSATPIAPIVRSTPAQLNASNPSSHRRRPSSASYQDLEADDSSAEQHQLAPPRPFFLAATGDRYSSASSAESDSSDVELSPPTPSYQPRGARHAYQPIHVRRQSGIAMSAQSHLQPHEDDHPQQADTSNEAATTGSESHMSDEPRSQSPLSPPPNARRHSAGSGSGTWSPTSLYQDANGPTTPVTPAVPLYGAGRHLPQRAPPSSFTFPFQAYPGNPDPLTRRGRSGSVESITNAAVGYYPQATSSTGHGSVSDEFYHPLSPNSNAGPGPNGSLPHRGSLTELRKPFAPFMASGGPQGDSAGGSGASTPPTPRNGSTEVLGGAAGIGGHSNGGQVGRNESSSDLYRQSAAANMSGGMAAPAVVPIGGTDVDLPRNSSTHSFRAPFLSPASRPTSSIWSPPSYATQHYSSLAAHSSPSGSTTALPMSLMPAGNGKEKEAAYMAGLNGSALLNAPSPFAAHLAARKPPLPSTRLAAPLTKEDKPWLASRQPRTRSSWLVTIACILLGFIGAALLCWDGIRTVVKLDDSRLCSVLNENFKAASGLDTNSWNREVQAGGYGTGSFEMMTSLADNLRFTSDSGMLLYPTLTSDVLSGGADAVLSGGKYTLAGCTVGNGTSPTNSNNRLTSAPGNVQADQATDASCSSNAGGNGGNAVVRPVMSARVNTKGKLTVTYGKVEVKARMPVGDWLWPSISLLPVKDAYGSWPLSGEMQLVAARGNAPTYPAQGNNVVRSALTYGPLSSLTQLLFGWYSLKRSSYAAAFHTYTLEWTQDYVRMYIDNRVQSTLLIQTPQGGKGKKKGSFWERAHFPQTAMNVTTGKTVVVENVWSNGPRNAPFDQDFYIAIGLAVGGTSGWFPDDDGNKPWFDSSASAMRDFAKDQSTWAATWPQDEKRGLAIESVKVWSLCK